MRDSSNHVVQMEKMLCMLEELQNIKRATDQKLQETEDEALALNRKVESLEQMMKETYSSLLSHGKRCGNSATTSPNIAINSRKQLPGAKVTEDLNTDTDMLQQRPLLGSTSCQ